MDQYRMPQSESRRLVVLIVRRWRWVAAVTAASILVAGVVAFTTTPVYRAEAVLVRGQAGGSANAISAALGELGGGLGGLAALAGFGQARDAPVVEALALLQSRQFTEQFIRERNLMPRLFHRDWDAAAQRWKSGAKPHTLWDGYRFFDRNIRKVEENRKTGVITVQIDWEDPVEAADWANDLVRRLNAEMRARAVKEATDAVNYLARERQKTDVAGVLLAIDKLMESNMKQLALANVQEEYVFKFVDPAAPPDRKERLRPHRKVYVITGAFFGLLLGVLIILGDAWLRNVRTWVNED
jgi:uncharacterized protein involved in exopolysaccharide biosynthesis